jgi:(p)ppGpp synthase/HD superfamily hydrolase
MCVASLLDQYKLGSPLVEAGLCHDLFEDTDCSPEKLSDALFKAGYNSGDINTITSLVTDLTDVYTKENFPKKNRKERKILEIKRLASVSADAQTVKYADLIDNTQSIVKHDPSFAKTYLVEKYYLLSQMKKGDPRLYFKACQVLFTSLEKVGLDIREFKSFEDYQI